MAGEGDGVGVEVGEVCRGLEFDFAMHFLFFLFFLFLNQNVIDSLMVMWWWYVLLLCLARRVIFRCLVALSTGN